MKPILGNPREKLRFVYSQLIDTVAAYCIETHSREGLVLGMKKPLGFVSKYSGSPAHAGTRLLTIPSGSPGEITVSPASIPFPERHR